MDDVPMIHLWHGKNIEHLNESDLRLALVDAFKEIASLRRSLERRLTRLEDRADASESNRVYGLKGFEAY